MLGFGVENEDKRVVGKLNVNGLISLKYLGCSDSNISELNLGDVPNLETLYCDDTLISKLDLEYAPNLEELICGNTSITNLDLSNVPKLRRLDCQGLSISKIDLSEVPNLTSLDFGRTLVSEIDLNKVPNLVGLSCYSTPISKLDLNEVPDLSTLHCPDTNISELDLSKVPKLITLECTKTQTSELDLSKVSKLIHLYCDGTQITHLNLNEVPNLSVLSCSYCKLNFNELKKIKSNYSHLYENKFENQNIFDEYIFTKGDIKSFGNETSTYKWFNDDELIENINTSEFDLSNYIGKKVRCEITDGDITLKSNSPTVIGVEFDNPPESLYKGTETKLIARLSTFGIEEIEDTSVSWSINDADNYTSSISEDGILKVSPDETSDCITVRATSNFNTNEYQEVKILIKTNPKSELQNAIDDANKINNKDNATIDELLKAIWDLSNAIIKYNK